MKDRKHIVRFTPTVVELPESAIDQLVVLRKTTYVYIGTVA
jgi:hypothetical protein